jgi:4-hydroxyphenylacetate 3-monooxygenase oxygenase component
MSVRTGDQFKAGLDDGREVWYGGERVGNVATFPEFRAAVESLAGLYDLQHDPTCRDVLVAHPQDFSDGIARAFELPRNVDDLRFKREAYALFARATCGMMGRSPDFLNVMLAALAAKRAFFAQLSEERAAAIEAYYRYVAGNDLFMTHALLDPQLDKSLLRHEQADPDIPLKVTAETQDGLILNGIKRIATAAPYADELLVWPFPPTFRPGEEAYATVFAVPMNTPGLKTLCRASFASADEIADHPLSARFDEMDATVVFKDVLVPWDRVFLHGDIELLNRMYADSRMRELTAHQTNVRLEVKLGFVYGLLNRLAEALGIAARPDVAELLGEAAVRLEVIRSTVRAAEQQATVDPGNGICYPYLPPLQAGRALGPVYYPELVRMLRVIGGGGLVQQPLTMREFDSPVAADLERSLRGAHISGEQKAQLMKLAWDLCGTEFGARHELYEMNYAGERRMLVAGIQREFLRKQEYLDYIDEFVEAL